MSPARVIGGNASAPSSAEANPGVARRETVLPAADGAQQDFWPEHDPTQDVDGLDGAADRFADDNPLVQDVLDAPEHHTRTGFARVGSPDSDKLEASELARADNDKLARDLFCSALTLTNGSVFVKSLAPLVCRILDFDMMSNMVKHGHYDAWKLDAVQKCWGAISKDRGWRLLHVAVEHQQVEFVRHLLHQEPLWATELVSVRGDPEHRVSMLWHCVFVIDDEGKHLPRPQPTDGTANSETTGPAANQLRANAEIRNLLVNATILHAKTPKCMHMVLRELREHGKPKMPELSSSSKPLDNVPVVVAECSLEIEYTSASELDAKLQPPMDENGQVGECKRKFEAALAFVKLTFNDPAARDEEHRCPHDSVLRTLDWLRGKGVRSIRKLTISGCVHQLHDGMRVAQVVSDFSVSILDWKHLDMEVSHLAAKENELTDLNLYSRGEPAALTNWLGEAGIKSLQKLQKVHIKLLKDPKGKLIRRVTQNDIDVELERLCSRGRKLEFYIVPHYYDAPGARARAPSYATSTGSGKKAPVPEQGDKLAQYLSHVRLSRTNGTFRPTKVAILDNGIEGYPDSSLKLGNRWHFKEGQSFFNETDSYHPPWYSTLDPHGTQMAHLIYNLDPYCERYIGRIAERRAGIKPEQVTDAINWAVDREVDIICMCLAIPDDEENVDYAKDLRMAIDKARDKGILLLCSHHDGGESGGRFWPADCEGTKVIAACDEFGCFERPVSKYDYKIKGMGIPVYSGPDREVTVTGSSAATAIVVGLASLLLSRQRLQVPDWEFSGGGSGDGGISRAKFVEGILDGALEHEETRFLKVDKFTD